MNAIELAKISLERSKQILTALVSDMQDALTTCPTSNGGNHPLWTLGHAVYSEAELVAQFIVGESHPLAKWDSLFGMGSTPTDDASKYPSLQELFAEFEKVRAQTLKVLDSLADADLDKPSHAPEELKEMFGTIGKCVALLSLHQMFHAGQVADARRAAGRKPVFA